MHVVVWEQVPSIEAIGEWESASPKKKGGGGWEEAAYYLSHIHKSGILCTGYGLMRVVAHCNILDSEHFVLVNLGVDFDTNLKLGWIYPNQCQTKAIIKLIGWFHMSWLDTWVGWIQRLAASYYLNQLIIGLVETAF